ncbi:MAG TPA: hypothetical protein VNU94_00535 [Acidobacteriaceae bacterium]|jgi:hypothetical protein|nr:hypothetical protein [Acidobacteriaceae bacterium]
MRLLKTLLPILLLIIAVTPARAQDDWTTVKTADLSQLDQIRYAQLTLAEKAALQTVTAPALQKCAAADATLNAADAFQRIRARRTDLGSGQGFVIEGTGCLCDAGNCEFWLVTADMHVLFDGTAQTYALLPSITAGQYDLVTAKHVSMTESTRSLYTFDGSEYQSSQCAGVAITNAFGNVQMKPTITMQKCQ